jgi:hypothetical protein
MSVRLVSFAEEPVKVTKKFYTITLDDEAMANIIASIEACDEYVDDDDFREQRLSGKLSHLRPDLEKAVTLKKELVVLVKDAK